MRWPRSLHENDGGWRSGPFQEVGCEPLYRRGGVVRDPVGQEAVSDRGPRRELAAGRRGAGAQILGGGRRRALEEQLEGSRSTGGGERSGPRIGVEDVVPRVRDRLVAESRLRKDGFRR